MRKNKVIAFKNMPNRLPGLGVTTIWLVLDRLKPAGWIVAVVWTLYAAYAVVAIVAHCTQVEVDVIDEEESAKRRVVKLQEGGRI